ncbi:MAG TPA: BrnT family toxin [Armatimonadetes bacterium]|nr:BrnT family toxin [Armatimonadota bacterium]
MRLYEVIWKERFVAKIADKHGVTTDEVEEVLFSKPHVRRAERGRVKGEDLYVAYGQTEAGRYLVVFFIRKRQTAALPISARDMTLSERRYYEGQKKAR